MSDVYELSIVTCKKCGSVWYHDSKSVTLKYGDKLNMTKLNIAHCSACSDRMDTAQKNSLYQDRRAVNRKK